MDGLRYRLKSVLLKIQKDLIMHLTCKICASPSEKIFNHQVLGKYDVDYFRCPRCAFVFTEEPHWLKEAYQSALNDTDTGAVNRNLQLGNMVSMMISGIFNNKATFLDFAGGHGLFVRLMRDKGYDFRWKDKYAENMFARGFEYENEPLELITAFEVFEHFVDPMAEIKGMLHYSSNILFSTEVIPDKSVPPLDWWYYGFNHGQHISLYAKKTLHYIAGTHGLNYYHAKNLHLFTRKKINNRRFQLLKKAGLVGLNKIMELSMKSRITSDHYDLLKKNNLG